MTTSRQHHPGLPPVLALLLLACLRLVSCDQGNPDAGKPQKFVIVKPYHRGPLTLLVKVSAQEITIADRLTLVLQAQISEAYQIKLPQFGEKLHDFGIVDFHASPPTLVAPGKISVSRRYVLEPFLSGSYKIPALQVTFVDKRQPEKKHTLETEAITIQVKSLLPKKSQQLQVRDIIAPQQPPSGIGTWFYLGLGGWGTIALVAALGAFCWCRRQSKVRLVPRRPAHEIAFAEIESLLAEQLIEQGQVKVFYQRICDILRDYIENRFVLHAPERTTEEFLQELRHTRVLGEAEKHLLKEFLEHCDLVKFACYQPTNPEIQKTFDSCKNFILATQPQAAGQHGGDKA